MEALCDVYSIDRARETSGASKGKTMIDSVSSLPPGRRRLGCQLRRLFTSLAGPLAVAGLAALGGCATSAEYGRVERLPEGTLPPSKEVGPPVNIQPAPLAREGYRPAYRPSPWGGGWGPGFGGAPGWHGRRCFDPFFCGPGFFQGFPAGRSGFGLHYRAF